MKEGDRLQTTHDSNVKMEPMNRVQANEHLDKFVSDHVIKMRQSSRCLWRRKRRREMARYQLAGRVHSSRVCRMGGRIVALALAEVAECGTSNKLLQNKGVNE